jgi:hypothetical protein
MYLIYYCSVPNILLTKQLSGDKMTPKAKGDGHREVPRRSAELRHCRTFFHSSSVRIRKNSSTPIASDWHDR